VVASASATAAAAGPAAAKAPHAATGATSDAEQADAHEAAASGAPADTHDAASAADEADAAEASNHVPGPAEGASMAVAAVTTAATPGAAPLPGSLSKFAALPATTRQTLGWVAVGTLFWAGVVWIWALLFLGGGVPANPEEDPQGARHLVGAPADPEHPIPKKKAAPKHAPSAPAEHGGGEHGGGEHGGGEHH